MSKKYTVKTYHGLDKRESVLQENLSYTEAMKLAKATFNNFVSSHPHKHHFTYYSNKFWGVQYRYGDGVVYGYSVYVESE